MANRQALQRLRRAVEKMPAGPARRSIQRQVREEERKLNRQSHVPPMVEPEPDQVGDTDAPEQ